MDFGDHLIISDIWWTGYLRSKNLRHESSIETNIFNGDLNFSIINTMSETKNGSKLNVF